MTRAEKISVAMQRIQDIKVYNNEIIKKMLLLKKHGLDGNEIIKLLDDYPYPEMML